MSGNVLGSRVSQGRARLARGAAALIGAAAALASMLAAAPAGAATVTQAPSGRPDVALIMLSGQIVAGDALRVSALVAKIPADKTVAVILNSPGGDLFEGFRLGQFFHRTRLPTFVLGYGGSCHSACSSAFLGGRDKEGRPSRTMMVGSELGFHQFRRVRSEADAKRKYNKAAMETEFKNSRMITAAVVEYLDSIGENMSKLHLMLQAPSANIRLLTPDEATAMGINVMDERSQQVIESSGISARVGQE